MRLRVGDVVDGRYVVLKVRVHPVHRQLEALAGRTTDGFGVAFLARGRAQAERRDLELAAQVWRLRAAADGGMERRARRDRTRRIWGAEAARCWRNASRLQRLAMKQRKEGAQ